MSYNNLQYILESLHNGSLILQFLTYSDNENYSLLSKLCRKNSKQFRWSDCSTVIKNVSLWRKCFPNAISINVSNTEVKNDDFSYLSGIKYLAMRACTNITDVAFHKKGLESLIELDISMCESLTSNSINHLVNLEKLAMIYCTQISGDAFKNLHKLKYLNMNFCNQNSIKDDDIKNLKNLRELYFCGCDQLSDSFYASNENIESLFAKDTIITGEHFDKLKNLKDLYVGSCKFLGNDIFKNMANVGIKLRSLDISLSNYNFVSDHFKYLGSLKQLVCFSNNINCNDLQFLQNIVSLNLSSCRYTGKFTKNIMSKLTKLKYFIVKKTLNQENIENDFLENSFLLKFIDVFKCNQEFVSILKNNYHNLQIIDYINF